MALNAHYPQTITIANMAPLTPQQILGTLNAATEPPDPQTATPEQRAEARRNLLTGLAIAFTIVRRRYNEHTLPRSPMVAAEDAASYLRCPLGLKRTFCPRVPEGIAELYLPGEDRETRRSDR